MDRSDHIMTHEEIRARLAPVRCFLLDMDGTFYLGDRLIDGSLDFLAALEKTGRTARFLTNNSSKSARVYAEKLRRLGVPDCREAVQARMEEYLRRLMYWETHAQDMSGPWAGFMLR